MPELPDVTIYAERILARFENERLTKVRIASPFVLRTYEPSASELETNRLTAVSLLGKRLVLELETGACLVIHLMIAGRFVLGDVGQKIPGKVGLLALDFETGSLLLNEYSKKKRASLHLFRSKEDAKLLDRGGIDVLECTFEEFKNAFLFENRTLKRALTDPRILAGIGNAYSDEILFWANLGPVTRTQSLSEEELGRLFVSMRHTLKGWTRLLRNKVGDGFPEKVTAFRPEMAVHGRFGKPCLVCGNTIQRIRYADNETNYCPACQTKGRVLADRSLSQLLHDDFPRTLEALEEMPGRIGGKA